jgi:hypothetical protein
MSYNWTVNSMSCYPQAEGQTDVVFLVYFGVSKTATVNNEPYLSVASGYVNLTYVAGGTYIPYDQLTQEQVIGWVQSALGETGVADYEARVDAQIESAMNPPVATPPLPWATA